MIRNSQEFFFAIVLKYKEVKNEFEWKAFKITVFFCGRFLLLFLVIEKKVCFFAFWNSFTMYAYSSNN